MKELGRTLLGSVPRPIILTFEDHSGRYATAPQVPASRQSQRLAQVQGAQAVNQGVPVPNRDFIRIHAAVAGVLHMSGAAEAIDEVLKRFDGTGPPGDLFTPEDFEEPAIVDLKESIRMMQVAH